MSFDGKWKTVTKSPMGNMEGELVLTADGLALTGQATAQGNTQTIENGRVDGNTATWTMNLTQPMPIKLEFDVSIDGDTMDGNVKLGAFGTAKMTGTRIS